MQTYVLTSLSSSQMETSAGKVLTLGLCHWAWDSAGPIAGVLRVMNLNVEWGL